MFLTYLRCDDLETSQMWAEYKQITSEHAYNTAIHVHIFNKM